ncbi:MAG: 50S ribosomal protein L9 [Candidatus Gracilibacteria bacterium]|nr:50S ribosomal protein L9 [Candidatus Gracilibacteria bacterium]MDQ7022244.1 50S ribosomal protein L9 [Candidatus Gracilibacteria bacterium]
MKVLFKELVVNVGHPGDIKEVSTGYATNFLIPEGKAIELTPETERKLKEQLKKEDKHNRELVENRHKIAEELNGKTLEFKLRTGANGKVFGGIGEKDVIKAVKSKFKIELTKKHIDLPGGHIKKLGESQIFIKLGKDSMAKITANVISE